MKTPVLPRHGLWLCFCVLVSGEALASGRVALLVGNAAYADLPLKNPPVDVGLMEQSLKKLDFRIIKVLNGEQKAMQRALRDFGDQAREAEVAFFYYSGHGLQVKGENYLVPVGAQIGKESDIAIESLSVSGVMQQLEEARPKVSVVVLDACRDNPWQGRTKSTSKGLGRVEAPGGTLVAYATSPNTVASDEGLFARELSRYLVEPGLELRKVFDKVGSAVDRASGGKQRPRKDDGLYEDVFLSGGAVVTGGGGQPPVVPPVVDADKEFWDQIKDSTDAGDYGAYLDQYPGGKFAALARSRKAKYEAKPVEVTRPSVSAPVEVAMARPPAAPTPRVEADAFAVGKVFRDCGDGCPEMVVIPAGSFMMGSPEGEGGSDEKPRHSVSINYKLAVGRFEVTFAEWDACVAGGGCNGYRPDDRGWGRGRRPVMNVSWNDIQSYVQWLSGKTGKEYRLLSESEWEYVARAGTTTAFSTGNCISTNQANYDGNYDYNGCGAKTGVDRQRTVEVGSFASNGFGLYDVHGNVWEWVSDCYENSYSGAPLDGSARTSCAEGSARVLRGGSWVNRPDDTRAALRFRYSPTYRLSGFGFRLARRL